MNKLMDLSNEGTVTGRVQCKVENPSNIPKSEYLESIKVMSNSNEQFQKAHEYDAGYDILAAHTGTVPANSSNLIGTELFVQVPKGYVGILKSRSGLSVKQGIDVGAGVIDASYTGEIKVLLRNTTDKWFDYNAGDKIAQMVVVPICPFSVQRVNKLNETDRGSNGFGSTGV